MGLPPGQTRQRVRLGAPQPPAGLSWGPRGPRACGHRWSHGLRARALERGTLTASEGTERRKRNKAGAGAWAEDPEEESRWGFKEGRTGKFKLGRNAD